MRPPQAGCPSSNRRHRWRYEWRASCVSAATASSQPLNAATRPYGLHFCKARTRKNTTLAAAGCGDLPPEGAQTAPHLDALQLGRLKVAAVPRRCRQHQLAHLLPSREAQNNEARSRPNNHGGQPHLAAGLTSRQPRRAAEQHAIQTVSFWPQQGDTSASDVADRASARSAARSPGAF